jgi:antitoxin HicB
MRTYTYRATLEPGENLGVIVVSFEDVPEAITEGDGMGHALDQAEEVLGLSLLTYLRLGRPLPEPKATTGAPVSVAADVAAKLAVLETFAVSGITKSELARRLGCDEREARRILDPMHATKLPALTKALAAMGQRLVIGLEPIEKAA